MPDKYQSRKQILPENSESSQLHSDGSTSEELRERGRLNGSWRCQSCGFAVDGSPIACPMCGLIGINTAPAWQRVRALIRWHNASQVDGEWPTPPNLLMRNYYQACIEAKQLKLAGHTERAIAAMQGVSKTAVHNRLRLSFSLLRRELRRIFRWLPLPTLGSTHIGIDQSARRRPRLANSSTLTGALVRGMQQAIGTVNANWWLADVWLDNQRPSPPEPAGWCPF